MRTLLGPRLPFALLVIVSIASVVQWTRPLRQRLEWKAEEHRCTLQLHEFYRAFEDYRRDTGFYPRHPMALYPKYVRDLRLFVCPAYRDNKFSRRLLEQTRHDGNWISYTYAFPYLTLFSPESANSVDRARVPIMFCRIHAEERYEAAYRVVPERARQPAFIQRYGVPLLLVLRQNGKVDIVDDLAIGPKGRRGPEL
jgi:hypothetical protein